VGQGIFNKGAQDVNNVILPIDDFFLLGDDVSLSIDSRKRLAKICFSVF
jgi:hypothetical protein